MTGIKINENIRAVRKKLGLTQDQFSQKLSIKRSLVGAYEEGRAEPRLELLQKISALVRIPVEDMITRNLSKLQPPEWSSEGFKRGGNVLVVTTDGAKRENIELVPHKAAAGYLNGYADTEFISELPKFSLPMIGQGTFRAFEITGDSMLPILPGTVVVGEYVGSLTEIKSGKTYILVTKREGIIYKRVFNYLNENGKLFLVSDNRQYSPFPIDAEEIIEAWSAKAYISVQFPEADTKPDVSVEQLAAVILDLQKEILKIKTVKSRK